MQLLESARMSKSTCRSKPHQHPRRQFVVRKKIQFIGGSQDGAIVEGSVAPDLCDLTVADGVREIYERQNSEPPFVYVQIGYAETEPWR